MPNDNDSGCYREPAGRPPSRRLVGLGVSLLLVGVFLVPTLVADHQPANKVSVASTNPEKIGPFEDEVILTSSFKASKPTDLVFMVTLECALFTDTSVKVTTDNKGKGNKETAVSTARVEVWLELDGEVLPVYPGDHGGAPTNISLDGDVPPKAQVGRVVFCHRTQGLQADLDFEAEEELNFTSELFIRLWQGTRSANAFNWMTLDVGSGMHTLEVHAQILDDEWSSDGGGTDQKGVIGKRTLVVLPVQMGNDETI